MLVAQKTRYELQVPQIGETIALDGLLNEKAWQVKSVANNFYRNFPDDKGLAKAQTEVRMVFNDKYLYIGAILYNESGFQNYTITSLKRDFQLQGNDALLILLDTYGDQTNAFGFMVNPFGVQSEFLGSRGGADFDYSWDDKWMSKVIKEKEKWTVEIAIPFSTLRFDPNKTEWKVVLGRNNIDANERSSWVPIARNFQLFEDFGKAGKMIWEAAPRLRKQRVDWTPSVTTGGSQAFDERQNIDLTFRPSLDAKIGLNSALNLDLTLNPDFSQVEVDEQQANISRFEPFFPEKRQFFIENGDLFSSYGFPDSRPFFSRRIGLVYNERTGLFDAIPIIGGAKLSGKPNEHWRIGVLSVQTARLKDFYQNADGESSDLPSYNYTSISSQHQLFERSNLSGLIVNKQSLESNNDFNRTWALQANLASSNNKWTSKIFASQTFSAQEEINNGMYGGNLLYNTRNWWVLSALRRIEDGYNAETGFIPRKGTWTFFTFPNYIIYPKSEKRLINNILFTISPFFELDTDFKVLDRSFQQFIEVNFDNTAQFGVEAKQWYTRLQDGFDPSSSGGLNLQEGDAFYYNSYAISFISNRRKLFSFSSKLDYGTYFNGQKWSFNGDFQYRIQPYGSVSLQFDSHFIDLPLPYSSNEVFLVGPRLDWAFSKNLFFSFLVQYNNLIDNVNVNARLQWRFRPVSDIFLVYTDNYNTNSWQVRNRALMLKIKYLL